jgi:hypothetical protein
MRQYLGAVITVRKIFTPLCLFLQTSPNNLALASGNKNRFFTQKLQINFDCHNAGLTFNYCLRFDPPNFSLPSTFKTDFSIWFRIKWLFNCFWRGLLHRFLQSVMYFKMRILNLKVYSMFACMPCLNTNCHWACQYCTLRWWGDLWIYINKPAPRH